MDNIETGIFGEDAACDYLIQQGYQITARNYRSGNGELDIIAWANPNLLVFVEVKTRTLEEVYSPIDAVGPKKQKMLALVAGAYMKEIHYDWAIRFDIISVSIRNKKVISLNHLKDAFFPRL